MADAQVVFCDALCLFKHKFGKMAKHHLCTAILHFYSGEELSAAKRKLLDDIWKMRIQVDFPYVSTMSRARYRSYSWNGRHISLYGGQQVVWSNTKIHY